MKTYSPAFSPGPDLFALVFAMYHSACDSCLPSQTQEAIMHRLADLLEEDDMHLQISINRFRQIFFRRVNGIIRLLEKSDLTLVHNHQLLHGWKLVCQLLLEGQHKYASLGEVTTNMDKIYKATLEKPSFQGDDTVFFWAWGWLDLVRTFVEKQ